MDFIWCLYCLMRWLLNHTDDRSNAQSANLQTDVCYVWLKVSMHLCVNYLTDYSGKTENNYTGRFKNQTMYLNSVDSFSLMIYKPGCCSLHRYQHMEVTADPSLVLCKLFVVICATFTYFLLQNIFQLSVVRLFWSYKWGVDFLFLLLCYCISNTTLFWWVDSISCRWHLWCKSIVNDFRLIGSLCRISS